jgi:hypothetical protein
LSLSADASSDKEQIVVAVNNKGGDTQTEESRYEPVEVRKVS